MACNHRIEELLRQPYADLALAFRLLDQLIDTDPCERLTTSDTGHGHQRWAWTEDGEMCATAEARALLARHGIREA